MNSMEMPKYKCHKEVWALKIKFIKKDSHGGAIITPEEKNYAPFEVDSSYINKHNPKEGGYFVVYKGGYQSFSPAEAFKNGYSLIL